jgi:hypothetical protein
MQYCYNAQAATSEDGIIVATALSASPADAPQLVPMVDAVRQTTGKRPAVVLADAGYRSEENLRVMRRRRQRCLVAIGREKKGSKWPCGRYTQRMHFRRFSLRGEAKARGEWELVCAALNIVTI